MTGGPARPRPAARIRRAGPASAVTAVLCCAVLLVPAAPAAAAPPPGTSAATGTARPGAAPSGGADSGALPVIGQSRAAGRTDGCVKPSDKGTDRMPWAQTFLRPEAAWQLSRGAGVTVAVVGSGVDPASGVLGDRLVPGPREYGDGDSTRDCVGHGTFLAGLIAARRQDGVGFAGIAPEARILAVAVTDSAGNTTAALLAKGIRDAADGGARVIAVALPVQAGDEELAGAVRYAGGKGALVVAPAGPDQGNGSGSGSGSAEVLAVSDLGPNGAPPGGGSDSGGSGAAGSGGSGGFGGSASGISGVSRSSVASGGGSGRIDLVAPGDAMMSVGPGGKGYFTGSGPSFAAAVVAGTAALVLGYRPDLGPAQLKDRLTSTAYHPGTALPDPRLGYGTVDPLAAVGAPAPAAVPPSSRPAPSAAALQPPSPDPAGRQAIVTAGAVLTGVALVTGTALVCTAGRRRAWRPGRWQV
ncbi:S8 family serine peptidase [Kitasatospora aureofaciens]|uniref:S8 family serine peptidase n=1 Tax=Kitasatospora aureofaciens TaxID=1894 RepID=UPI001C47CC74|nr:S8 family serine peptidase [Kitasatospora aureofaciens]MBV6700389.1 S8 family serine peptidase [Kitasatospora aureofaciens]